MRHAQAVRSTRWPLASCALTCGLLAACSPNKGPATSAYLREFESASGSLAGQIRDLPRIAPPSRPFLPVGASPEQQRVYDGTMRIYPLFVNQYYGAVMERCQAISQLCSQTLDHIGSMNAAGADPDAVQLMTLGVQAIDQQRDFFAELRRLADLNRTALVRRKSVDSLDEVLSGVFDSAIGGNAGAAATGPKEAAGALSKRQGHPYGIGEQVARLAEGAGPPQSGPRSCRAARPRTLRGRPSWPQASNPSTRTRIGACCSRDQGLPSSDILDPATPGRHCLPQGTGSTRRIAWRPFARLTRTASWAASFTDTGFRAKSATVEPHRGSPRQMILSATGSGPLKTPSRPPPGVA